MALVPAAPEDGPSKVDGVGAFMESTVAFDPSAEKYIPPPQTTAAEIHISTARDNGAGADKSGINSGNNNGGQAQSRTERSSETGTTRGLNECPQCVSSNPAPNLETVSSLPQTEAEAHSAVKDKVAQGRYNLMVMVAKGGFELASNPARSSGVVNGEGQGEARW
ncbi:hypothetical protein FB45DRAFT_1007928, partial [Roridomyces roridus]